MRSDGAVKESPGCRRGTILPGPLQDGVVRWRAVAEVTVLRELEVAGRREEDRVELVDELLNARQARRHARGVAPG